MKAIAAESQIAEVIAGTRQWCVITGDCLEVLPTIPSGSIDAVVTDPPYGCGFQYATYQDSRENWERLIDGFVPDAKRVAKFVVMPIGDRMALRRTYIEHSPDWMIAWFKGSPGTRSPIGFNSWEPHPCWGRPHTAMHDAFQTRCGFDPDGHGHPCPKPIEWALWLVERAACINGIVLDPFCGSGTTGVACIQTGRRFIGIEIDEKYAAIARRRIADAAPLFVPPPVEHPKLMEIE